MTDNVGEKSPSLHIDTNIEFEKSNMDEMKPGVEQETSPSTGVEEINRKVQSPLPTGLNSLSSHSPPPMKSFENVEEKHKAGTTTPEGNSASTTEANDDPSEEKKNRAQVINIPAIPQSPSAKYANVLLHSTLTPITRNTYIGASGEVEDLNFFVVSPDGKAVDNDYLSTLAIPGSNDLDFDNPPHRLALSLQHPSLNSLPDEIFLSNENSAVPPPHMTPSPRHDSMNNQKIPRPSPTHRSKSVGNLDINAMRQTTKFQNAQHAPIPESPSSPYNEADVDSHSAYFNSVSAPSEFFEHLSFNDFESSQLNNTAMHNSIFLEPSDLKRSVFKTSNTEKPFLYRGVSMNTALVNPSNLKSVPTDAIKKKPSLQYQPSRRDNSLTDVGINKNTEGVNDIFTTRSPERSNNDSNSTSSVLMRPIPLDDRQMSIPSLRLANRLGNDSTASFTDGEYSWEEDEGLLYGSEEEGSFDRGLDDAQAIAKQVSAFILPNHDGNRKETDDEIASNAAVGSISTDNLVKPDDSLTSFSEGMSEIGNTQVTVELATKPLNESEGKHTKRRHSAKRRHSTPNPLEWIHNLQCGSENKVGEAASSKFLTKGIAETAQPRRNSYRMS